MILTTTSCREDFVTSSDPNFQQSVNLNAELSNDDIVQISLLKNIEIGADYAQAELDNALITFSGSNIPNSNMNMVYDADRRRYVLENLNYRVEEGYDYAIEIVVDPNTAEEEIITANTYIPRAVRPSGFRAENITFSEDADGDKIYRMTLYIQLNEPEELPAFYHLSPYRFRSESRRNNDGSMSIQDYDDIRYKLDVDEVIESENGIVALIHKDGVFVDQSKISNNEIKMIVETGRPLTPNEVLHKLDIDVSTLSPDLYHYNIALDKEIRSVQANYTSPIDPYSNVQNGYGIFGGSSMIQYAIEIQ
ncbi:MAG: hypothetical protein ACJA01_000509 [Saprospiraceae bacterium]